MAAPKKLKFVPNPTFQGKVEIPLPGGEVAEIDLTFKHRTGKEVEAFDTALPGRPWGEVVMDIATGWEFEEAFTRENVDQFLANYATAGQAIYRGYVNHLLLGKAKN